MKQANRERGCVIWFTGLSGSGKTTTLRMIGGRWTAEFLQHLLTNDASVNWDSATRSRLLETQGVVGTVSLGAESEKARLVHSDLEVVDAALRPVAPSFWRYQFIRPERCDWRRRRSSISSSST